MPDDEKNGTPETFTRADVRRMIGAEVAKVREQFADYDDLKARAGEADKSKSAIERIEAKLDEQTKRADKAERETLIRDVAEHFGVSVKVARKFDGNTRDEMISDGAETLTEMGIEPDKSKRTKGTTRTKGENRESDDDRDESGNEQQDDDRDESGNEQQREEAPPPRAVRTSRRPTENLRSGAPRSSGGSDVDKMTPAELANQIRI